MKSLCSRAPSRPSQFGSRKSPAGFWRPGRWALLGGLLCLLTPPVTIVLAQGTAFTYQGRLNDGTDPANGSYDFRFRAASDPFGNSYVGSPLLTNGVNVARGLFTLALDFGPGVFTGSNLWLEISVRTNGGGSYSTLNPLQAFTASPYAVMAGSASNLLGALPASQLTGTVPSDLLSGTYSGAVTFSNAASSFTGAFIGDGNALSNVNASALGGLAPAKFWQLGGNAVNAGQFLGSTNNQPLELRVNGQRSLRLEPNTNGAPNVIAGASVNFVSAGAVGATISGGGATNYQGGTVVNSVTADWGTVSGGQQNTADQWGTVGGGDFNSAGFVATVGGGGFNNASGFASTVGGGQPNTSSGSFSTVGGGAGNLAAGDYSTVPGGNSNLADGADSFAAGTDAHALHPGTFVWADSSTFSAFSSTASNQFLIQASGGVGIGTPSPSRPLEVQKPGDVEIGLKSKDPGAHLWTVQSSGLTGSSNLDASFQVIDRTLARSRFYIGTNGNVGIGTSGPASLLHVASGSAGVAPNVNSLLVVERNNSTFINVLAPASQQVGVLFGNPTNNADGGVVFNSSGGHGMQLRTGGNSPRLTIDSTGNVGIGTTLPSSLLSVFGDVDITGSRLHVDTGGNIGLGTSTPASKLDVRGDIRFGTNAEFFAVGGVENLRVLRGRFNATTGAFTEGIGLTGTNTATGHYTITFTDAFSTPPTITVTAFSTGSPALATVDSFNKSFVNIRTWTIAGAAVNTDFMLIATGPR